jgi:hypothetical protein
VQLIRELLCYAANAQRNMDSVHDIIFFLEDVFTLSILMHPSSPKPFHVTALELALFVLF